MKCQISISIAIWIWKMVSPLHNGMILWIIRFKFKLKANIGGPIRIAAWQFAHEMCLYPNEPTDMWPLRPNCVQEKNRFIIISTSIILGHCVCKLSDMCAKLISTYSSPLTLCLSPTSVRCANFYLNQWIHSLLFFFYSTQSQRSGSKGVSSLSQAGFPLMSKLSKLYCVPSFTGQDRVSKEEISGVLF